MSYPIRLTSCLAALLLFFAACEKDPVIKPPVETSFEINIDNQLNELQAKYAVYLSDSEGKVVAFRWLPGSDTVHLQALGIATTDRLDCTVVKLVTVEASGTRDTSLVIRTYTNLASGENIRLQTSNYQQTTDLDITFTNLNSLDTLIVPDGLAFIAPDPSNNFSGLYRVLHTGKIWLRVKVNGEQNWRYLVMDNISGESLSVSVDVSLLPVMLDAPKNIAMPFTAAWQYKIEGLVDTANYRLFPIGDSFRTPGGAVPVFSALNVFEPVVRPYNGYRISMTGSNAGTNAYTYSSDRFYPAIPASLPVPSFDVEPTTAVSERYIAVKCVGTFDLLAITRSRTGNPNITWEAFVQPTSGIVSYRLPDVPKELNQRFFALGRYNFSGGVRVRAEQYERLDYQEAVARFMRSDDPIWQAKAGYLSREEVQ